MHILYKINKLNTELSIKNQKFSQYYDIREEMKVKKNIFNVTKRCN